jgi:hypothetical protein
MIKDLCRRRPDAGRWICGMRINRQRSERATTAKSCARLFQWQVLTHAEEDNCAKGENNPNDHAEKPFWRDSMLVG